MKVEVISHPSGDLLPILLDSDGLPIPAPNEFIIGRRALSHNTLVRNLREISIFYGWIEKNNIDLNKKTIGEKGFTDADIKGGLIEFSRRNNDHRSKVKKMVVKPHSFNSRLATIRQFLAWNFDMAIGCLSSDSKIYERVLQNKVRTLDLIDSSIIKSPPVNMSQSKGVGQKQIDFLVKLIDPSNGEGYGRDAAVRHRNYIMTLIMLYFGLRPGELLSLWVSDITYGAISSIRVQRRAPDPNDKRRPRPQIKRNGRVFIIEDMYFAKYLDDYIRNWRNKLEDKSDRDSQYLILSDEGEPLSQVSVNQFYKILRDKYPDDLPATLCPKAFRHTFSSEMEKLLRKAGLDEDRRKETLAYLRGDSSLDSQNVYILQEIHEQSSIALGNYQKKLINGGVY